MNVARLVASVGGYFYSTGSDTIAVHLYGGNTARIALGDSTVRVKQEADYPWSGKIRITVEPEHEQEFALKLRIPGWARTHALAVNGSPITTAPTRGYVDLRRRWRQGDVVQLDLPMPVEHLRAHPDVRMDVGRVCLQRGPLVYCAEQIDNAAPLTRLRLPPSATPLPVARPDLFGGIVALAADAEQAEATDALYRPAPAAVTPTQLVAVPYYIWANRGPNRMLVWLPVACDRG